jgi:hypothetical protein
MATVWHRLEETCRCTENCISTNIKQNKTNRWGGRLPLSRCDNVSRIIWSVIKSLHNDEPWFLRVAPCLSDGIESVVIHWIADKCCNRWWSIKAICWNVYILLFRRVSVMEDPSNERTVVTFFLQVYMYKVSLKERVGPVKYEFIWFLPLYSILWWQLEKQRLCKSINDRLLIKTVAR